MKRFWNWMKEKRYMLTGTNNTILVSVDDYCSNPLPQMIVGYMLEYICSHSSGTPVANAKYAAIDEHRYYKLESIIKEMDGE
jgi:hypothetical protein